MEKKTEARTGLGFADALALLFIGLKLCKVIDWPWVWVLSPVWISIGIELAHDALVLLKEQEPQPVISDRQCEVSPGHWERKGFCPKCHQEVLWMVNREYCGFCGQKVKWE